MNECFPKFLIVDNNLIIAKCTYHKDLIFDKVQKIKGGGLWYRGNNGEFILNGTTSSSDFGKSKLEDIERCVKLGNIFTNKYMTSAMIQYDICYFNGLDIINITKLSNNSSL